MTLCVSLRDIHNNFYWATRNVCLVVNSWLLLRVDNNLAQDWIETLNRLLLRLNSVHAWARFGMAQVKPNCSMPNQLRLNWFSQTGYYRFRSWFGPSLKTSKLVKPKPVRTWEVNKQLSVGVMLPMAHGRKGVYERITSYSILLIDSLMLFLWLSYLLHT